MLSRCNQDVDSAVKELKVEKLVDMGIVASRDRAIDSLLTSDWDVNLAAEILLSNLR